MNDYEKIFVRFRGRTLGPLTSQKVNDLIRRGQITRMHELSGDGLSWSKAEDFGEFFASAQSLQPVGALSSTSNGEGDPSINVEAKSAESTVNPERAVEPKVEWYAHVDSENKGPISLGELQRWRDSGLVQAKTLVWRSGLETWQPAEQALPDLFGAFASAPGFSEAEPVRKVSAKTGGTRELAAIAHELGSRRGWALFFAILLVVLSSFQIVGQLVSVFVAASATPDGVSRIPILIGAILGIAFAGTILTSAILLIQYCVQVKECSLRPTQSSALVSAQRLSRLWSFLGVASLIWLVILLSFLLIVVSIGLTAMDAII